MLNENLYTPNCMRTYTGRYVNLLNPQADTIYPVDIAVALSRLCRFAGHTKKFYSVAQHSILCMEMAQEQYYHLPNLPLIMLLHDAHEYILGDVASPLKKLLTDYEILAKRLQKTIHYKFGVSVNKHEAEAIKDIDKRMLEWEWKRYVLEASYEYAVYDEKQVINNWLHYFVKLVKYPVQLQ